MYCSYTTLGNINCYIVQDSALAHRARRETLELILPDFWPLNSPDLNPVDCPIWGMMQDRVYQTPLGDVTDLRQRLIDTWRSLSQSIVDDATD